jgi:signal transduction histidine kinase
MLFIWALLFAAGYELSEVIFRFTGRPAAIWTHTIAGLIALLLLTLAVKIFVGVRTRAKHGKGHWDNNRNAFLENTIEAMERIAHGDFSVIIPVDKHNPFSELAESVNKMARELGTMENLRQDFISNISHEIQSPLTSIGGFAALLKNDALTPKQRSHYIEVIETEARRLSKLSDNLLKLSTLESSEEPLTITTFSLDKQIQNAVLILEPQWMEKKIDLSLSLEKIDYKGDEALITQVWINLIHNAIKFTPEQGEISIILTNDESQAVCRISDTGIGISEEDRMHIFERFYKADKARERALGGSGLGLSLVKKIVELHGGKVFAESAGKGSMFTVMLPFLE